MNRIVKFVAVAIFCFFSAAVLKSFAANQALSVNEERKNIIVEIDYGDVRPSRTAEVLWLKNKTALEVLQSVATVETHPVGEYIFVSSIDGVEGRRGDMAWYYTVDSKPADKLAYLNVLTDANYMKWEYKKDVCSSKVDKNK